MFELESIVAPEVSMVAMALCSLPQLNYVPAMEGGGHSLSNGKPGHR